MKQFILNLFNTFRIYELKTQISKQTLKIEQLKKELEKTKEKPFDKFRIERLDFNNTVDLYRCFEDDVQRENFYKYCVLYITKIWLNTWANWLTMTQNDAAFIAWQTNVLENLSKIIYDTNYEIQKIKIKNEG